MAVPEIIKQSSHLIKEGQSNGTLPHTPVAPSFNHQPPAFLAAPIPMLLASLAEEQPGLPLYTFLTPGENALLAHSVTVGQLHEDTGRIAAYLEQQGIQRGDLLVLAFRHGYDLVATFLGALYLGALPTIFPYYTPGNPVHVYRGQVQRLIETVQARAVLTEPGLADDLSQNLQSIKTPTLSIDCSLLASHPFTFRPHPPHLDDLAFIQFSSGTTGLPKGVMLTHRSILSYLEMRSAVLQQGSADIIVGWLPLYHDMGLLTQIIQPLYCRSRTILINPADWLARPHLFFEAIDQYKGTMSWMPNFAFRYCLSRIPSEKLAGLDLSSLRILLSGSEPVQLETIRQFADRFAAYGLRREVITVGYGMAEHVAAVTFTPADTFPAAESIDGAALQNGQAVVVAAETPGSRAIVSCGYPMTGIGLRIVNDQGQLLPDRHVGEVQVKSPALFLGYYHLPEETAAAFRDGWFCTGDLGYLVKGQLYICGRKKDLIIVGGRNIHPHHLEALAQSVLGPHGRYTAAFGLHDETLGTELAVLACEMRQLPTTEERDRWQQAIREQISAAFQLHLHDIVMVEKGWIVKTTSGKINRTACGQKYLAENPDRQRPAPNTPHPARSPEQRLITIWENLFKRTSIGLHHNFFELGGDSLLAVRLLSAIEEQFQCQLPTAVLFEHPTIAQLTTLLQNRPPTGRWSSLVPLQPANPQTNNPTFFCVHGIGGGVLGYLPLAQALGPNQPFYALQADGGLLSPEATIETIAAGYLRAIRAVQPNGPYYLGGYCFGGIIAYEMARQLVQIDQSVPLVAVMEGYISLPSAQENRLQREWRFALSFVRNLPFWLRDYLQLSNTQRQLRNRRLVRVAGKRLLRLAGIKANLEMNDVLDGTASLPTRHQQTLISQLAAMRRYTPLPYSGHVTLFRTAGRLLHAPSDDHGWGQLAAVKIHLIDGSHGTILKPPHVTSLAAQLGPYLTHPESNQSTT
jgi:fatty-acyl-CoA synthase